MNNCILVKGLLVLPDVRQIVEYVCLRHDIIVPHPGGTHVLMNNSTNNTICSLAFVSCTLCKLVPTEGTDLDHECCTSTAWADHEGAVSGLGFRPPEPKVHQQLLHLFDVSTCTRVVWCRYQREAGEAVGVASGETWRTAFQAAAQHGASQVQETYQAFSHVQNGLHGLHIPVPSDSFLF